VQPATKGIGGGQGFTAAVLSRDLFRLETTGQF